MHTGGFAIYLDAFASVLRCYLPSTIHHTARSPCSGRGDGLSNWFDSWRNRRAPFLLRGGTWLSLPRFISYDNRYEGRVQDRFIASRAVAILLGEQISEDALKLLQLFVGAALRDQALLQDEDLIDIAQGA